MGKVHAEQSKGRLFLNSLSFTLGWYRTINKESLLHPDVTKLLTDPGESFGCEHCPPPGLVEIKGSPLACLEPDWGCLRLAVEYFGKNVGNCAITLFLFPSFFLSRSQAANWAMQLCVGGALTLELLVCGCRSRAQTFFFPPQPWETQGAISWDELVTCCAYPDVTEGFAFCRHPVCAASNSQTAGKIFQELAESSQPTKSETPIFRFENAPQSACQFSAPQMFY